MVGEKAGKDGAYERMVWFAVPPVRTAIVTLALLGLETVLSSVNALAQDAGDDMAAEAEASNADEMHAAVLAEDRFPSASACSQCDPKQYREWSVSPHTYGQLSPLVLAFQNASTKKVTSTVGDFCQRCHAPISVALGQPPAMSALDRPPVARESISCIACRRVTQNFGRITGRYPILEGDIHDPVYSTSFGGRLMAILNQPGHYQVQPNRGEQRAPFMRRSSRSSSCARRPSAAASVTR